MITWAWFFRSEFKDMHNKYKNKYILVFVAIFVTNIIIVIRNVIKVYHTGEYYFSSVPIGWFGSD